ncbi:MAG: hypothetical protein MMC33_010102, partial [Icmadophila ericetorum]|nr:hypothetical protein [Icmadophila ericetorum]
MSDRERTPSRKRRRGVKLNAPKDWARWADLMESILDSKNNRWALVTGTRTAPVEGAPAKDVDKYKEDCSSVIR